MFFREVLNEDLGCGSYVVADGGEAAVVDPKWEYRSTCRSPKTTVSKSRAYLRRRQGQQELL